METRKKYSYLDKIMMAVTFAEAGEYETAKRVQLAETDIERHVRVRPENRPAIEL